MAETSLQEMLSCVDRELAFRGKVYPRWVNANPPKMTPKAAALEMERMGAVRARLVRAAAIEKAYRDLAGECGLSPVEVGACIEVIEADVLRQHPVPK